MRDAADMASTPDLSPYLTRIVASVDRHGRRERIPGGIVFPMPVGYEALVLVAEFDNPQDPDDFGVRGHALVNGEPQALPFGKDANRAFAQMRQAFIDAGAPVWRTATVTVTPDDQASVVFS